MDGRWIRGSARTYPSTSCPGCHVGTPVSSVNPVSSPAFSFSERIEFFQEMLWSSLAPRFYYLPFVVIPYGATQATMYLSTRQVSFVLKLSCTDAVKERRLGGTVFIYGLFVRLPQPSCEAGLAQGRAQLTVFFVRVYPDIQIFPCESARFNTQVQEPFLLLGR